MNALWLVLAFVAGAVTCWYALNWLMRAAFKRKMLLDIIKGLHTETVVLLHVEAEKEITRRRSLLAEKARAA